MIRGGVIESTYHTKRYLDKMLSSGEIACNFEYIIWSITQTADLIYNMIEKNWPNAKLRAVIDRSKKVNYKGMQSYTKEKILEYENAVILVCSDAAIEEAEYFLKKNNISKYFYCCQNDIKIS